MPERRRRGSKWKQKKKRWSAGPEDEGAHGLCQYTWGHRSLQHGCSRCGQESSGCAGEGTGKLLQFQSSTRWAGKLLIPFDGLAIWRRCPQSFKLSLQNTAGVMPTLGLSKQGYSPSQLQSLPYHSEISCRMFWQHTKPAAQGNPKPSAANPKTPPGLCHSLSQHLPWLLLAFKIYLKEMGLI